MPSSDGLKQRSKSGRPAAKGGQWRWTWLPGLLAQALLLALSLSLLTTASAGVAAAPAAPAPAPALAAAEFVPSPRVADLISQVQQTDVYTTAAKLTGLSPVLIGGAPYTLTTRNTASGLPIQQATRYVTERLQAAGLTTVNFHWASGSYSGDDVTGILTGTTRPSEIVLMTAHLDDMPSAGAAPGADDNASGSTALLMAAQVFAGQSFSRTVRLVFFTGEEQGLLGSQRYAQAAATAGENIVAVYNVDMIGWDNAGGPVAQLHTRPVGNGGQPADLAIAGVFTNVVATYGLGARLTPVIVADGNGQSDHASFWARSYPALLVIEDTSGDFTPYYHTSNDTLSTLNLDYFTAFVQASVGTVAHLAELPPARLYYLPLVRR